MASAYVPGLKVSRNTIIEKVRRLPMKGEVLVGEGDKVTAETVVAKAEMPGMVRNVKVHAILGCAEDEIVSKMIVKEGDEVEKGDIIARSSSFFGLLKSACKANCSGTIDFISPKTGNVGIRQASKPVTVTSYIDGTVGKVIPEEGVIVRTTGCLVQGIFGVGKERIAEVKVLCKKPDEVLTGDLITEECGGKIVVGGAGITFDAIKKGIACGIAGMVSGAITDSDIAEYLGYEIGVAITGEEDIPFTLIITEGFGSIPMNDRAFELLTSLDGKRVSMSGATQIRAGVIRPEIIRAEENSAAAESEEEASTGTLEAGTRVRIIREPYFGMRGTVADLPAEAVVVESGAKVRVSAVKIESGEIVTVPRANLELMF
ncbi:MAG: hypothetical protein J6332_04840 [Abditibacteriota bacterium]|nr:hypothetical protein [Abditibacteriota bacterium]